MFSVKELHDAKQLFGVGHDFLGEFLVGGEAHHHVRPLVALELQSADAADDALARVGDVPVVIGKQEVQVVAKAE